MKSFPLLTIILALTLLSTIEGTNALTWDGTTNEGCVSFEPLGSCPETNFTNTIREVGGQYVFDYNGSDVNISYSISKITTNNSVSGPYHGKSINATISKVSDSVFLYGLTVSNNHEILVEFLNGTKYVQKWCATFEPLTTQNITNQYVTGKNLITTMNCILLSKSSGAGISVLDNVNITFNTSIVGKTLLTRENSTSRKIVRWIWGRVESPNLLPVTIQNLQSATPSTTLNAVNGYNTIAVINKTYFINIIPIADKSRFSELRSDFGSFSQVNSSSVDFVTGTYYYNKTNQEKNVYDETIAITLSDNVLDVLLYNPNNASSKYTLLKDKWFVSLWSGCTRASGCMWNISQRFQNYGFDTSKLAILSTDSGTPNPDRSNYTNSLTRAIAIDFKANASSLGIVYGFYNSLQDIYNVSPFKNNTAYNGININAQNFSFCMRNNDSTLVNAYNDSTWGQSCAARFERRKEIINYNWNNQTNDWGASIQYLDVEGSVADKYFDYNSNSTMNGSFSNQFSIRREMFDEIRQNGSSTYTENSEPIWTAGMIDAGDGSIRYGTANGYLGTFPDYELSQISTHMVRSQAFLGYYMLNWNGSRTQDFGVLSTDETYFDRYIVNGIMLSQNIHMDNYIYQGINMPDNKSIMQYYSSKYILEKIRVANIINVSYYNGTYLSASQATASFYNFSDPMIFEEWSNGLRIYANLNRTGWWNLTINGATRNIPPNGLYAYIINDTSFEMFFNDANLSTWVKTPTYIYLYPKNNQQITFSGFSSTQYSTPKVFYGNDSSNGLRQVADKGIYTTRTTRNAELLVYDSTPYSEVTCGEPLMEFSQSLFNLMGSVFLMLIIFALARILTGQFDWTGKEFYFILTFIIIDVIAMFVIVMGSQLCIS